MMQIYSENTANYPRLKTDMFFDDFNKEISFSQIIHFNNFIFDKNKIRWYHSHRKHVMCLVTYFCKRIFGLLKEKSACLQE